jgi:glyoxylase-like metal-dependent hydrolase (beta-lactamase superfamily II)
MTTMSGIKFSIIELGEVDNDQAWNVTGMALGTKDNPNPPAVWWRVPMIAILVQHPEAGNILYDSGNYLNNNIDRLPQALQEDFPNLMTRKDYLDVQLKEKLNMSLDEIDAIIISHAHFDHLGGVGFFSGKKAGQNVYISRKEFETALLATHQNPSGLGGAYFKGDLEFPDIEFKLVDEDTELFPGIEVIHLVGHTPATLGMVLHCGSGQTYIFPSDAVYTSLNYGPPAIAPGLVADTLGFSNTIRKLNKLEKKYNAKVVFPHDPIQIKQMKTAPYFYE